MRRSGTARCRSPPCRCCSRPCVAPSPCARETMPMADRYSGASGKCAVGVEAHRVRIDHLDTGDRLHVFCHVGDGGRHVRHPLDGERDIVGGERRAVGEHDAVAQPELPGGIVDQPPGRGEIRGQAVLRVHRRSAPRTGSASAPCCRRNYGSAGRWNRARPPGRGEAPPRRPVWQGRTSPTAEMPCPVASFAHPLNGATACASDCGGVKSSAACTSRLK